MQYINEYIKLLIKLNSINWFFEFLNQALKNFIEILNRHTARTHYTAGLPNPSPASHKNIPNRNRLTWVLESFWRHTAQNINS